MMPLPFNSLKVWYLEVSTIFNRFAERNNKILEIIQQILVSDLLDNFSMQNASKIQN